MDKDHLWVDILKKKYLRDDNFMTVCAKLSNFYARRSMLKGRIILGKGLGKIINNG